MELKKETLFSNRNLFLLIIPLMIEQFLSIVVGMVDTIMIAEAGETAVSAVSLADSIMVFMINLFAAMATAGSIVCGHLLGRDREKESCVAADQLFLFTMLFSCILTILFLFFNEQILSALFGKAEKAVFLKAKQYIKIVIVSVPFLSMYYNCVSLYRIMGNSSISMTLALFMNGMNVIGNAILIYVFHMGVVGAAISTLSSRIITALVLYGMIRNEKNRIHLSKKPVIKADLSMIKRILKLAIPNGMNKSLYQLGKIMVLSLVSSFGTMAVTANAIAGHFSMFQCIPGIAISYGLLTVISRCAGGEQFDQVRYYQKKLTFWAYGSMLLYNGILSLFIPFLLKAYQLSEETYRITFQIIMMHGIACCIIWPPSYTYSHTLQAVGETTYTMIIAIASTWIFRIGFSYLLGSKLGFGIYGVWMATFVDWAVQTLFYGIWFRRRKWEKNKL